MSDLLASAEIWLKTQRKAYLAKTVTIRRGASETANVSAMHGSTLVESSSVDGLTVQSRQADFLIDKADYEIASVDVEPMAGDQIELADGRIFELCSLGEERVWRWHDRAGLTYRLHARYIGTTEPTPAALGIGKMQVGYSFKVS